METETKPLEKWMRAALFATAAMNITGAITFVPGILTGRALLRLPESHPLYLWILSIWIFSFGACYLSMALTQRHDRTFIAIGAIGKLSFFGLMTVYALAGDIGGMAVGAAVGDLVFGIIFIYWLLTSDRNTDD